MASFKPKVPTKPETFTLIVPGTSQEAALLSEQLLIRNNKEFDIFFNDKKFHNHLIYHLLGAYSLGASKEKIQEIFDHHAKIQRPAPTSVGELTRENYKDQLGKGEAYTSFLNLFQSEVEKYGAVDTARRWIWSDDLLARTVAGGYHPLIHIGYGLEFDIPDIVAEGLAMAACTESDYIGLVPRLSDLQTGSLPRTQAQVCISLDTVTKVTSPYFSDFSFAEDGLPSYLKENTLLPMFSSIREDPAFDNLFAASDNGKYTAILSNQTAVDRIKHYVNSWEFEDNSKNIQARFKELFTLCAVALGSAGIRKDQPGILRLDFFLMHALTSSEFLHQYISRVLPFESIALLKAHLSATILHYVTAGRPDFYIEGLLNYKSPSASKETNNQWTTVLDKALNCKEAHVIKVVRSCAVAQVIYGPQEDARLNDVWLHVAQMAIDKNGTWDFATAGYD